MRGRRHRGWDEHAHERLHEHWHRHGRGPWQRPWINRVRLRRLQTRLFFWFLAAIFAAFAASGVALWVMRGDTGSSTPNVATHAIATHLSRTWDDPQECERYVESVRELIGMDVHLRRDVADLPQQLAMRGGAVTFERGKALIPVRRDGELLGAVEVDATHLRPRWNAPVALGAALFVLAMAARGVARRLAWPMEDVADAAERFGNGDLSARTRLGGRGPRRGWVASEVRGVAQAFDGMATRIERVVRDQRELLAAISHELRSPLGRARVALETARDRGTEETRKPLDDIDRQIDDIDAILGDLLAAARAGLSDVKPVATAVAPWLRARIAAEPPVPAIELVTDAPESVTASIDAQLLNRALHNLFANARAHGHPDGEPIEVRLDAGPTRITITARDHGPGFPPDLLPRAFEPFVKGDVARSPGSGYGLGLALVQRIAEAHGGRAFARNADGGGAEVGIDLPVAGTPAPTARPKID